MPPSMPTLRTNRLLIRPFLESDLDDIHRVLSACWSEDPEAPGARDRRRTWLHWATVNVAGLEGVRQPPYGDRAVILRAEGHLIGSVGLVPSLGPFGRLPGFPANAGSTRCYPEVGLFWAIDPPFQGQGFATEAAQALVEFVFSELHLGRIIAMTEYDNVASQAVMRKLRMRILANPDPEPAWFQVVGLLEP